MTVTIGTLLTQSVTLPTGARTFGPATLAAGVQYLEVELATASWGATTTLEVLVEVSFDSGAHWEFNSSDGPLAPPFLDRQGNPTNVGMSWSVRDEDNANRRIRVTTTVVNGPLPTVVTVRSRANA